MNSTERDRLYVDKAYQYLADTDFDGNVEQYLRTMLDEYEHQAKVLPTAIERKVAEAKAYAYRDAVRVFDDAILAALAWARQA